MEIYLYFFHLFFFLGFGTDCVHLHRDHHGMLPLRRPLFLRVCELQCIGGYWSSVAYVQSKSSHKNTADQLESYCKFIQILTLLKIAANLCLSLIFELYFLLLFKIVYEFLMLSEVYIRFILNTNSRISFEM